MSARRRVRCCLAPHHTARAGARSARARWATRQRRAWCSRVLTVDTEQPRWAARAGLDQPWVYARSRAVRCAGDSAARRWAQAARGRP